MQIKNLWFSTAYRGVYALLVAAALVVDFGFMKGEARLHILNYYTVLSNIACMVFFAVAHLRSERALKAGEKDFSYRPRLEGAMVFCIAVTGIVYAVMLAPADLAAGKFFTFDNLVLHYVGPAMVILDWLLFSPKRSFRPLDPLLWLCIPLVYFGYILLRSTFAGDIGNTGSAFPYGFIDPVVQGGWSNMFWSVAQLAVAMLVLGYVIYIVDWLLARSRTKGGSLRASFVNTRPRL
jgi:hypothetical protein